MGSEYLYVPLSGEQMMKMNPDAKLIRYTELNNIDDINDMFGDTNKLIILYLIESPTSGHWTCLMKKDDHFEWFDSYGFDIDEELNFVSHSKRKQLNEQCKDLVKLLSPYRVVYNNVKLQGKDTQTCGDHVTCRLYHFPLTLQEYVDNVFLDQGVTNPDEYVAEFVNSILN